GELATTGDFAVHVATVFPEVRLKRYLEMRGADGGPWKRLCALPALWVGLLYDSDALDAATKLVADWTIADHEHLRREVPRFGLKTRFRSGTVQDLAQAVLAIARDGLARRARDSGFREDETCYLDTLQEIAESGITPAEELLQHYRTRWHGSVDPVFREYAY